MGEAIVYILIIAFYLAGAALFAAAGVVAGPAVGFGLTVYFIISSMFDNFDFRDWDWPQGPNSDPARRGYFFGPGLRQLGGVISDMFGGISASGETLALHRTRFIDGGYASTFEPMIDVFAWVYFLTGVVVSALLCTVLAFVFSAVLGALFLAISAVSTLLFLAVRLLDALYLAVHRIRSDCPVHKGSYRIPAFRCSNPSCGRLHRHLIPNAYGTLHHRCQCGTLLPCTFFNGRGRLQAYCPLPGCEAKMVASDARPVVFQLIGGSHAGKSVFLASAIHLLRRRIAGTEGLDLEIPADYEGGFSQLERWFSGQEPCVKTTDINSQMYPLLVRPAKGTRRVLTFYDIAGERFSIDARSGDHQQLQLGYCDSIVILLDPFSSGTLRQTREQDGVLPDCYSSDRAEDVVVGFVNYLIHLGVMKVGRRYPTPVYVLIAKADEREVYADLGPSQMRRAVTESRARENPPTVGQVRDQMCQEFLQRCGLQDFLNALQHFETVHYYPISAMGHADTPGAPYSPWGIEPLLRDLIAQADPELSLYLIAKTTA